MERDSPRRAILTKLRYTAPLSPWISLPGTHFAKPIKLAKDPELQREACLALISIISWRSRLTENKSEHFSFERTQFGPEDKQGVTTRVDILGS